MVIVAPIKKIMCRALKATRQHPQDAALLLAKAERLVLISSQRAEPRSEPEGGCKQGKPLEPQCPRGCNHSCGSAK